MYNDLYYLAKRLAKKLIKDGALEKFKPENLFYFFDEKTKGVVVFSPKIFSYSFGIQLFFNNSGLNYLHDIFSTTNGFSINPFFSEAAVLCFSAKKDLMEEDIAFLKKHNIRIQNEYNLLPYKFNEGYGIDFMNNKELELTISYLYYLTNVIKNDEADLLEAFDKDLMTFAFFDNKEHTYNSKYLNIFNFETFPSLKKKNLSFIEEFSNYIYTDDICYISHCYLPIDKDIKESFPSILLAHYKNKDLSKNVIFSTEPKKLCDYIFGFLDDIFKEYGLPTVVVINNRKLYSTVFKTLKSLNIEVRFERENEEEDELIFNIVDEYLEVKEKKTSDEGVLVS